MTSNRFRVLIVDDEPLARELLAMELSRHCDVELLPPCVDGPSARVAIESQSPDIVFLDIQMPGQSGMEVARDWPLPPHVGVIFVTAYEEFALQAFGVSAIDYLLKPFSQDRFEEALQRARDWIRARDLSKRDAQAPAETQQRTVVAKIGGRRKFISMQDIRWLEASGSYVKIHVQDGSHLARASIASFEKQLPRQEFARIHRSRVVAKRCVREFRPLERGDCELILDGGERLRASRSYREKLRAWLDV